MFKKYSLLMDDAPADGNGNQPAPAAPPVARTVLTGTVTEREADLQAQIDILKAERDNATGRNKKLETEIARYQDELDRFRQKQTATPATPEDDRTELEKFMDGE